MIEREDEERAARRDTAFLVWACCMSAGVGSLLTSVAILLVG